ncbi:MAG: SDR family NAD(P)-dependent oxidoreductase [Candidatus Thorarchaeota archaeon]|nr:SDR family NAD(P)-dependent oxidoreductase [Candidatus Thorarchaeota archaeon]
MDLKLKGKHILITGASGGIGIELTKQFLTEGVNVTACYNREKRQLSDLMESFTDNLLTVSADIRKEDSAKELFTQANSRFGRVDGAIANAGIANHEGVSVSEMSLDQWDNTLRVNLTGSFLTAKHFFQNLEKYPGDDASLILVGSTAGLFGEAWYSDYSTSKAGMHGMMMSLKNEIVHLASRGRVNLVNPGWTVTPMAEGAVSDPIMVSRIVQTIPLRKIAEPADIASTIVFLTSDYVSGHVSGQTVTVAGGMEGRVLFTPDEVSDYVDRYTSKEKW